MPIRHEGDYQRKEIRSWDSWVDDAIREAQERGDFDNLPDAGKPIKIEESPFAPEMQAAFSTLKNAGYSPTWMELDREITRGKQDLEAFAANARAYLDHLASQITGDEPVPETLPTADPGWWARLLRWLNLADDSLPAPRHELVPADVEVIRSRFRDQYIERAAAVDKKITEFHGALPRNLWHLERMRITPEYAARQFDQACPSIPAITA